MKFAITKVLNSLLPQKNSMYRGVLVAGAFLGLTGIIIGAFAAHGLKPLLSAEAQVTFETGVKYQMYAAFLLLILGFIPQIPQRTRSLCFYLTLVGAICFSGSIYALATNSLTSFDFTVIALVTPLGGTLMIAAWIMLLISFSKLKKK